MFKKILLFIFAILIFSSNSYSIEVSQIEAERRLEFNELFSKKTCDTVYKNSSFGMKKKLEDDVMVVTYHNIKRININETQSILSLFLDQRTFFYQEPKLEFIIFNALSEQDFSEEMASINKSIEQAKTKKIVVCEFDLNKSISEGKYFDVSPLSAESFGFESFGDGNWTCANAAKSSTIAMISRVGVCLFWNVCCPAYHVRRA